MVQFFNVGGSSGIDGAAARRDDKPRAPLFSCKSDRAVCALKHWVKDLDPYDEINVLETDRIGFPIIKVGSNSGGRWAIAGVIVCDTEERRAVAAKILTKELRHRERS